MKPRPQRENILKCHSMPQGEPITSKQSKSLSSQVAQKPPQLQHFPTPSQICRSLVMASDSGCILSPLGKPHNPNPIRFDVPARYFFPGTLTVAGKFPGHPGGSHIDSLGFQRFPSMASSHPLSPLWALAGYSRITWQAASLVSHWALRQDITSDLIAPAKIGNLGQSR